MKKGDLVVCKCIFLRFWYEKIINIIHPKVGSVYTVRHIDKNGYILLSELVNKKHYFAHSYPFLNKVAHEDSWAQDGFEKIIYNLEAIEKIVTEEINQVS